jgi:enoyl-CoA hydratase
LSKSHNPSISVEQHGSTTIIGLIRPEVRNRLSSETLSALEETLEKLKLTGTTRALIITGNRNLFAAGADIGELSTLNTETALPFARRGQSLLGQIESAPFLTIAAINGFCMGGGLDLALACKLRFASPDAIFSHPGGRLGIITGWGGTQRLTRLVGVSHSLEMFLTAKRVNAEEAARIGLVNAIVCDPVQHAIEVASCVVQKNLSIPLSTT